MKLINYVFNRVYSFYKKKKDSTPIFMGCAVLAISFYLTLLSLMFIAGIFLKTEFHLNKVIITLFFLAAVIGFVSRFNNRQFIDSLEEKYGNEDIEKKRRNALYIALYILTVFLIPIVYGILKHNFHVI
jgi:hypothetical protein